MSENPYEHCAQCPRKCGAQRSRGKQGFCGEAEDVRAASAGLHFGEEPLITVFGGSGTVFFTGCTLHCAFCQNYQISQQAMGGELSREDFVKLCLLLEKLGAENINLVTASHIIPKIAEYLAAAKDAGLKIPVAWNSSAYESTESLSLLHGLVDIWLPDLKTLNSDMSSKLFDSPDYPKVAKRAIRWMLSESPMKIVEKKSSGEAREKMISGVIIRHLFLPGRINDTILALDWLKAHADGRACISLMSQYTPVEFSGQKDALFAFENRLVNKSEDIKLKKLIAQYDFEYLFYQDLSSDTDWLPDFSREQPFSNALARPVWHWKRGFLS